MLINFCLPSSQMKMILLKGSSVLFGSCALTQAKCGGALTKSSFPKSETAKTRGSNCMCQRFIFFTLRNASQGQGSTAPASLKALIEYAKHGENILSFKKAF